MHGNDSGAGAFAALGAASIFFFLFGLALAVFILFVQWRIVSKAGYPGVASLLLLVPLVNAVAVLYFAFSEWPIERELRAARGGSGSFPPGGYAPPTPTYPPPVTPTYLPPI